MTIRVEINRTVSYFSPTPSDTTTCTDRKSLSDRQTHTAVVTYTETPVMYQGGLAISGTPAVGKTLKAEGNWAAGAQLSYQWLANGKAIPRATGSSFKLAKAQLGKRISVKVSGKRADLAPVTQTSASTAKIPQASAPKMKGSLKVGKTLTVSKGKWTPGTKFSYQWFAGGIPISKATKAKFKLTRAQRGKQIGIAILGRKSGYETIIGAAVSAGKVK